MPKPVDVLVKEIFRDENGRPTRTGEQTTISYKSFLMLNSDDQPRFELLGEVESVDKNGNIKLREGNPNLEAQHRQLLVPKVAQRDVAPVVSTGPTQKELDQQAEIERLKALLSQQQPAAEQVKERKKPGPKSKKMEGEVVA